MSAKSDFCKAVTILQDTREREASHITDALDEMGVRWEVRGMRLGDYSFEVAQQPFHHLCVIERKANPDELYNNLMEKPPKGQLIRLEKEVAAATKTVNQFTMLLEDIDSMEGLRDYVVPDWQMKMSPQRVRSDIGRHCYERLRSWQSANRYGLRVECVQDKRMTAKRMLELFYYWYSNYKILLAPRK